MSNKKNYILAFNALKKKFHLKNIKVERWSENTKPYIVVECINGNRLFPLIDDLCKPYHYSYANIDDFYKETDANANANANTNLKAAKALFTLAQKHSIYLIPARINPMKVFWKNEQRKYLFINKVCSVEQFLITEELAS